MHIILDLFSWCSKNEISSSSAIVASRLELLLRELGSDPTPPIGQYNVILK